MKARIQTVDGVWRDVERVWLERPQDGSPVMYRDEHVMALEAADIIGPHELAWWSPTAGMA